jgi:hypothetical protein
MKKHTICLWFCLLFMKAAIAQGGWQMIYPMFSGGPHGDGIHAVRQTPDGGYIMVGISEHNSAAHHNRVVKVSDMGVIQWTQSYSSVNNYSWASNVELAPAGGYYVEGHRTNPVTYKNEVYIQRLDANGNELWVNFYPEATIGTKGSVTSDGGYVAIGYDYDNINFQDSVALIKIDAAGNLNWIKKFTNSIGIVHSVIQTMNNEYIVEGYKNSKIFLCKFDATGDSLWHQMYGQNSVHPEYIGKVVENADGSLTVAGNSVISPGGLSVYLFKTDANGALIWSQHYGSNNSLGTDLDKTADGGYVISGIASYNASPKVLIIKTDANGNQEWLKEYNGDGTGSWKPYSVRQTTDGGYIVGASKVTNFYTRRNMYLIKTDELGEIYSNTLKGYVYADFNADCQQDSGDFPMANRIIEVAGSQTFWTSTDANGYYWLRVDTGNYQMILHASASNAYWQSSSCSADTFQISIPNQLSTIDTSFVQEAIAYCPLLTVDMSTPFLRRCFNNNYFIHYCNNGTAIASNAYVDVQFDSFLIVDTTSITVPWMQVAPGTYRLYIGDVGIGVCGSVMVTVLVSCNASLGQTHCNVANIYPTSSCLFPAWNNAIIELNATCQNDSVIFTLTNTGAAISSQLNYYIYQDTAIVAMSNYILAAGQSTQLFIPNAGGSTYIFVTQQEPGYPAIMGDSLIIVSVEGCGGSINTGVVTQFSMHDESPFIDIDCRMNIGAYDPNDKNAHPVGFGTSHFITPSTVLDYHIRFQNTGTDTAFTVIIRDTISDFLDITTLVAGSSSHSYTYMIHGQDHQVVDFIFNNIQLPDSNVNEPASHGFIQFKIKQKPGNPIGTIIENTAGIYFDFNEPIITNTTFHEIGQNFIPVNLVSVSSQNPLKANNVRVYPNPSGEDINFEVIVTDNRSGNHYRLSIYDGQGRLVTDKNQQTNRMKIERGQLESGFYFYRLLDKQGNEIGAGKFIVK